ncbi:LysR family transcriptional regulator [Sphaerochaeta globosa]|uniref:Transcriptional regulator, LysR family n=1 Tax=Sphaerochaeta globosa (strain ATCC BAA-1886 / DSM 22777 / Buddy) TaxID=158189 RepID=F0RRU5_SPHGB|nr:LysR family transcriptional regulator [Sphaerochaeta globosa]ADY14550.1 transcriptional regulator, LysR family [Sphaerochaeta globosa str. Buddy]
MQILKYQAVLKAVELGNFTKAAEALHCTQSAISRMVKDLEEEWDLCLLQRSKQGVRLTSEGQALYPTLQRICNEQHGLETQVGSLHQFESGSIRIGTVSSIATHLLPPALMKFKQGFPNIHFELLMGEYEEIAQWIRTGRVDFGFLRLPVGDDMDVRVLLEDPLLVVLPNNHPLCLLKEIPPKSLEEYPFILLSRTGSAEVPALVQQKHLALSVHYRTWDDYAVMAMVEQGLGISILPSLIVTRCSYTITTRTLEGGAFRTLVLAQRKGSIPSLAVQEFLPFL